MIARLRHRARQLKHETYVLYLACRDPRTPWYAKALAGAVVAYALSPIDLIPDFVPVLGYADDLIVMPAGIALALRLIPAHVLADCRARAEARASPPRDRRAAVVIVVVWLAVVVIALRILLDAII